MLFYELVREGKDGWKGDEVHGRETTGLSMGSNRPAGRVVWRGAMGSRDGLGKETMSAQDGGAANPHAECVGEEVERDDEDENEERSDATTVSS